MIRLATRADVPEIERVMRASVADLSAGFYDARETASALRYITIPDLQLIDDGSYYVVEEDGRVVACGGWSARKKLYTGSNDQEISAAEWLDPGNDPARIRAMFVDPAYARRGLGRLILRASEEAAARAGFTTCELMATLPGVPLYRACGYEEIAPSEIVLGDGVRIGGVIMRRRVK